MCDRTAPLAGHTAGHARCLQMETITSSFVHHQPPEISRLDRELVTSPADTFLLSAADVTSISTTSAPVASTRHCRAECWRAWFQAAKIVFCDRSERRRSLQLRSLLEDHERLTTPALTAAHGPTRPRSPRGHAHRVPGSASARCLSDQVIGLTEAPHGHRNNSGVHVFDTHPLDAASVGKGYSSVGRFRRSKSRQAEEGITPGRSWASTGSFAATGCAPELFEAFRQGDMARAKAKGCSCRRPHWGPCCSCKCLVQTEQRRRK
jgi:hypothetical protein